MIAEKSYAEVRRRFAATTERVFAAFAKAELVGRWLTPSPEIKLTVFKFDFREGGSYRFAYRVPGATTVIVGGSYTAIKRRLSSHGSLSHLTNTPALNPKYTSPSRRMAAAPNS